LDGLQPTDSDRVRFEEALKSAEPFERLRVLAIAMRDEGRGQGNVLALFEAFRSKHAEDPDETLLDAILDVMDHVSGWCSPHNRIFASSPP
jgi:hypothetical protein